jgi:adenylosuccinate synthase
VGYTFEGREFDYPPEDTGILSGCTPVYEDLPGWEDDLTGVMSFESLPENARRYVERLEDLMGIPVRYVSVGPAREQTFEK